MTVKKAKIIKADYKLRRKTGYGEISDHRIERAESLIIANNADFREIALPALAKLREAIAAIEIAADQDYQHFVEQIIGPIMELKANGQMFKYDLVGALASVMLGFLEQIHTLDKDAVAIISAHEQTLSVLLAKEIKGDGGPSGLALQRELKDACSRYYRKNPDKFKQ